MLRTFLSLCVLLGFCNGCAPAEECKTGMVDTFDDPAKWVFNGADSPWVSDVSGTVKSRVHVTEGESATRLVFDENRGVGKAQIFLKYPDASGNLSCGTHLLVDIHTDQTLFLRLDFHDRNFHYRMGKFVVVPEGMNRDVRLPLSLYSRETLESFNQMSFMLTGHEPDSTVVFDNLRLVKDVAEAGREFERKGRAALSGIGNLARGSIASASSQEGADKGPGKGIDGIADSRWASVYADEQWYEVRLPEPLEFNQIVFDWESAYGRQYSVLIANNNEDWEEVAVVTDGRGGVETVTFSSVTADRVRIELHRRGTQYGYSFHELQLRHRPDAEPGISRQGGVSAFVEPVTNFRPRSAHVQSGEGPPEFNNVRTNRDRVPVFGLFEAMFDLNATHDNPYDPADIDVVAEFTSPEGKAHKVPAFFMWPFERTVVKGQEQLRAADLPEWHIRFTPTQPGRWEFTIRATDRTGATETEVLSFLAIPSKRDGFIRINNDNPYYFATDTSDVFFPVGLNMCWYVDTTGEGNLQTVAYDRWLESLAANGGNFIRIWMFSVSFNPEWIETGLGQYDERQPHLWRLDYIMRRCEELGIRVQFCLLNHGQLSLSTNSEWNANPYNAAIGGPIDHPVEFLTDETARTMFRRRLRYLMARYSYSPNVFAWEWFNEIENTSGLDTEALLPWVAEMTDVIREWDPNHHLITTSAKGSERVYGPDSIDFTQPHMYEVGNWPPAIFAKIHRLRNEYRKPVFVGELGIEHNPPRIDPAGRHLHTGNWASLMSGAAGGAMTWWWDSYVAPRDLWHVYRGISSFAEDEPLHLSKGPGRKFAVEHPEARLEAMALDLSDRTLLWIRRKDATATAFSGKHSELPDFSTVTGATLSPDRLDFTPSRVEWWNTAGGTISGKTVHDEGNDQISIPGFRTDIAAKFFATKREQ